MSVQFRLLRPEDLRDAVYAGHVGFGMSTADTAIEQSVAEHVGPDTTLVAVEDGTVAAQVTTLSLSAYWNGHTVGCGGVASVTTLPSHRRRGFVRELLTRSLAQMYEAGQSISLLWPTMAAIYQRFGYGLAFTACHGGFDARRLAFVDELDPTGHARMLKLDESLPLLAPVYERFAAMRTPMIERDEVAWERRRRQIARRAELGRPPWLAAIYEEGGEILGYIVYDVVPNQTPSRFSLDLTVQELVWLSPAAHRALIQLLVAYDLGESVRFPLLPLDEPLFWQAQEPRNLQLQIGDGALLRIVDVAAALEGRGYDADGRIRLALQDEICPWNSGIWEMDVDQGAARCHRTTAEPELRLTPRALAMLASGCQTATTLARVGLVACTHPRALQTADRLFQTACAPFCMDRF